ncbi:MAG: N-acyl-D-amino-acid deacylase family protein [Acidimicrobiales bacterium]
MAEGGRGACRRPIAITPTKRNPAMLDYAIRNGLLVDGTGAPGRRADVGVRDGKIVAVGEVTESATTELDAGGLVVAPGIIDPHTHYDAQLFWDATASPSNLHGVTTVIGGNCGFTLAPIKAEDHDYIRRMMAKVEGMPLVALENGLPWDWTTFGEYLARIEGHLGVNAGFLVGHCALRRWVMGGERASEVAGEEDVAAMCALLAVSIEAGGLGFSSSQSRTHSDGDGNPISSRYADRREMLAFCEVVAAHPGTTLEYITSGCLDMFSDEEMDLMVDMSTTARRPLNWNLLTVDSRSPEKVARQLEASSRAAIAGGKIVALTMPTLVPMNMSFRTHCALFLIPGWGEVMGLPVEERIARLRDPAVRTRLDRVAHSEDAGVFRRLSHWANYVIGDTFAPVNEGLGWRDVGSIAAEQGKEPFDALLDIVIADDLRTVLWPKASDGDDASWQARLEAWDAAGVMIGGSDAGAHLDRMCGSNYPTSFLGDCLRKRKLVPMERAIQMMTEAPAELFGIKGRGRVAVGYQADVFVFDPGTVGSEPATLVNDLPGGSPRLIADAIGVVRVLVNGVETVVDGKPTGNLAGTLLRSGRDTVTVDPSRL